jgi:tetratricopeptide (TPR) repeat protein
MLDQAQKAEETQAVVAMWLMLGQRFLQQQDIAQDSLKQAIADCEALVLPKVELTHESPLVSECKQWLGWAYNTLNVQYDNQQDYPQALAAISKAIEYQPQDAMYYRNRAGTYMDLKNYAHALPDLEKAQELEPDAERLPTLWQQYRERTASTDDKP